MRSVRALQGMEKEMQEIQAQVRETMIRQEMMFQEQVRELHRLYQKQMLLMHELKNKNCSSRRIKEEASSSSWELGEGGHTRDLLHCLNRQDLRDRRDRSFSAVKRRKMLDLEQLPDDTDEDTEYVRGNFFDSINENAALDFGEQQWRSSQSQTLSLFPIPSNTASASTISNLEIERSWDQQQFSQRFGRLSDQISISHQTVRDPWNPLGQDGARLIGEIVRDYQQDGRMDNYFFGGMVADSFAASTSRNHFVQPATWKQQMPSLSYSYHQPSSSSKFCFEGNRIYTDSLRNSWCLSGNLTLPPDKPPVPVLVKAEESASPPKLKLFTRSNADGGESEKVGRILNLDDERKCRTVPQAESDLMMKSGAADDGTVVNRLLLSCTDRNMNVMAMAGGEGEDHRVSARVVDLNKDCASDHEAVMQDSISNDTITWAATILLSLAPENYKCSSKARLESSSLLSSDVKLFKSVVIMLKQSGAKSSSKKLVVKSFHGRGGGGGKASAAATTLLETLKKTGIGNSEGDEDEAAKKANGKKKKENKSFSAWMWGDVTRRKRMQRHRNSNHPQQVQVRCLN